MTHDDALANFDAARRRFGDVCMNPNTTHDQFEQAQRELREAARARCAESQERLAGITTAGRAA